MPHATPRVGFRRHCFRRFFAGLLAVALGSALFAAPPKFPAIQLLYGEDEIFPSALISTTKDSPFPPRISQIGDEVGLIAVQLISPADDCPVTITLAATAISRESSISLRLPRRGELYRVAPYLALDHARIVELKHPIPGEVLRATITLPGEEPRTLTRRVRIHGVNDALVAVRLGHKLIDASYLTAAYINENNPEVPEVVIRAALALPRDPQRPQGPRLIESFVGYAGGADGVKREVEAVYRALKGFGFKYSAATRPSVSHSERAAGQWVRLSSDSLRAEQANCVDGTVILASVLTHLRLRVVVFIRPFSHTFMGVFLKPTGDNLSDMLVVETTELGTHDFASAVSTGRGLLEAHIGLIGRNTGKAGKKLADLKPANLADLRLAEGLDITSMIQKTSLYIVDVQDARQNRGIMPVPELMPGSRWRFPELPR